MNFPKFRCMWFCISLIFGKIGPGSTECEPTSGRLIDPATNRPFPDGSVCPLTEYCRAQVPPVVPPRGDCSPKVAPGQPCTTNAACQPGTAIEANKFVCSREPGAPAGICGCLHDYLTQQERERLELQNGFAWIRVANGQGCIKSVRFNQQCNPNTDVCGDPLLECRYQNGKSGDSYCLFPFASRNDGEKCYDTSDCSDPFSCEEVAGLKTCSCPPGMKTDPKNPKACIQSYVGYLIQCDTDDDCLPSWNIVCNPSTMVCDCRDRGSTTSIFEYFQQQNGQDRCYQTYDLGGLCIPDAVLTAQGTDHDCRRNNKDGHKTNLVCRDSAASVLSCACELDHFEYDVARGICVQEFAWYGEGCSTDSNSNSNSVIKLHQCDSKYNLMCVDFKCACVPNAEPAKERSCFFIETLRHFGESCDADIKAFCDATENMACTNGVCACVNHTDIKQEGSFCRNTNVDRRTSASSCLVLTFILNYIPLVFLL